MMPNGHIDGIYALVEEMNKNLANHLLDLVSASIANDRQFKDMRRLILKRINADLHWLREQLYRESTNGRQQPPQTSEKHGMVGQGENGAEKGMGRQPQG